MIPSLTLPSGDRMPVVGLGLWKVGRAEAAGLVLGQQVLALRRLLSAQATLD